jgi:hypothetical protein
MLSFINGTPIAKIISGAYTNKLLYMDFVEKSDKSDYSSNNDSDENSDDISNEFSMQDGKLEPRLDIYERSVTYISGPSGSGKTTLAVKLLRPYLKFFPKKPFYFFSRTNYKDDPAFEGLKPFQITVDESLITDPIDVVNELKGGSVILFDDCNTIPNEKVRKTIDNLMSDIMEVGRKLDITIIITNHLVIPNEKKFARTLMNEIQSFTFFPKSGSAQQIRYALKTYFGLSIKQIDHILGLPSRWVSVTKKYPVYVLYERGCFIL